MSGRAPAPPNVAPSGLGGGNHFADAAIGVAGEQRSDVLPHPRSTDLAGDAIRVLRCRELENQNQVRLVDLRHPRRERTRIDHELHPRPRRVDGRIGDRFAQTEMIDHNVHDFDAIA
jgi:hypothetical protein